MYWNDLRINTAIEFALFIFTDICLLKLWSCSIFTPRSTSASDLLNGNPFISYSSTRENREESPLTRHTFYLSQLGVYCNLSCLRFHEKPWRLRRITIPQSYPQHPPVYWCKLQKYWSQCGPMWYTTFYLIPGRILAIYHNSVFCSWESPLFMLPDSYQLHSGWGVGWGDHVEQCQRLW